MTVCERIEMELSAIADGAGEPEELAPVLDHLVECAPCRAFYRQVRVLDNTVAADRTTAPAALPTELWERIEERVAPRKVDWRLLRGMPRWALQAAALVVLGAGLWATGMLHAPHLSKVRDGMEIRIGEERGKMTDAQFVELAITVLKADPRYQRKMLEVLQLVSSGADTKEDAVRGLPADSFGQRERKSAIRPAELRRAEGADHARAATPYW